MSVDGLDLADDRDVLIGRDATGFAVKISELLQEPVRGRRLAEAGRRMVTQKYSWDSSARLLDEALGGVVARARGLRR